MVSVSATGNGYGITLPKFVFERFLTKESVDMEITDSGILLTGEKKKVRAGWAEAFCSMHENKDDMLDDMPCSEAFEWEW